VDNKYKKSAQEWLAPHAPSWILAVIGGVDPLCRRSASARQDRQDKINRDKTSCAILILPDIDWILA
jgi:hypothetical protein